VLLFGEREPLVHRQPREGSAPIGVKTTRVTTIGGINACS
jgi:hypothetical protein